MNANEYLQRSTLYRKLIRGPYGEFSRVYAARLSDEGFGRRCTWRSLNLFRDLMDWHVGNGHNPQDLSEVHVERFLEHRSELDFVHFSSSPRPEDGFICDEFEGLVEWENDAAHVADVLPSASM